MLNTIFRLVDYYHPPRALIHTLSKNVFSVYLDCSFIGWLIGFTLLTIGKAFGNPYENLPLAILDGVSIVFMLAMSFECCRLLIWRTRAKS